MYKRLISILFVLIMCFSSLGVIGCGAKNNDSKVVKGLPDYSADVDSKKLYIGGFCSPPKAGILGETSFITEQAYQDIADCGLDYILTLYEQGDCTENRLALDCAEKAGVKVLVRWDEIINYSMDTRDALEEALSNIINHPACWGIFAKDEPRASLFNKLGAAREAFATITDKYFYVNLNPNIQTLEYLQTKSYQEYVNLYCAKVKNNMIIMDQYPFGYDGLKYSFANTYLINLEVIQKYANYYGMEHWEYIQGEHVGGGSKVPDYYDFKMQAYLNMCYGAVNHQYFCYFSPFADTKEPYTALVAPDGTKTARYYDAQKLHKELKNFDHVYLNYANNWQGVMGIIGSENKRQTNASFNMIKKLETYERVSSVEATQDTFMGIYKDKDGRDGFMIVNFSIPGERKSDKVTINFNDADEVVYYQNGEYNQVKVNDGKFDLELAPGDGVFAIPVKY